MFEDELVSAMSHFEAASDALRNTPNIRYRWIIEAGPGLVALKSGDLKEASQREERLPEFPKEWPTDPTVPVLFKARMMERRGQRRDAIDLISSVAEQIKDRYVIYWIRLCLEEIPRWAKFDGARAKARALEVRSVAEALNLHTRVEQVDWMMERLK
ncbi:MAG: hypothetical protein BMS9Abin29_1299 [Gemmatimonadota bacterium]|nr:MAG: hypothetical protein BMS9Abin29_1299 [Gemmatimonadota bacterium]